MLMNKKEITGNRTVMIPHNLEAVLQSDEVGAAPGVQPLSCSFPSSVVRPLF